MGRHVGAALGCLVYLVEVLDDLEGVELGVVDLNLDLHAWSLRLRLGHDCDVLEGDQLLALLFLMLLFDCLRHDGLAEGCRERGLRTRLEAWGWAIAAREGRTPAKVGASGATELGSSLRILALALGQKIQGRQHEPLQEALSFARLGQVVDQLSVVELGILVLLLEGLEPALDLVKPPLHLEQLPLCQKGILTKLKSLSDSSLMSSMVLLSLATMVPRASMASFSRMGARRFSVACCVRLLAIDESCWLRDASSPPAAMLLLRLISWSRFLRA